MGIFFRKNLPPFSKILRKSYRRAVLETFDMRHYYSIGALIPKYRVRTDAAKAILLDPAQMCSEIILFSALRSNWTALSLLHLKSWMDDDLVSLRVFVGQSVETVEKWKWVQHIGELTVFKMKIDWPVDVTAWKNGMVQVFCENNFLATVTPWYGTAVIQNHSPFNYAWIANLPILNENPALPQVEESETNENVWKNLFSLVFSLLWSRRCF